MKKQSHKKILSSSNLKLRTNAGFTLVETVVAIFILSMSIGALLTLAAGGFFSVRYARNQIVADHLAQEALEYIRNDRDTASQARIPWNTWLVSLESAGCASACRVDAYATPHYQVCTNACPSFFYSATPPYYSYSTQANTTYVRTVTIERAAGGRQLIVTARMSWKNGANTKTVSQSMLLSDWNV